MKDEGDAPAARLLTLMRHAEAVAADEGGDDHGRALSARGRRDARAMATTVIDGIGPPARLLCSPARRAIETARLLCAELDLDGDRLVLEPALYLASADTLLAVIAEHARSDLPHLMLIGHNPGLEALASRFERRGRVAMSTAALRRYALSDDSAAPPPATADRVDRALSARLMHAARPPRRAR